MRHHLLLASLKFAPVHHVLMMAYREAFLRRFPDAEVTWILADEFNQACPPGDRVWRSGPGRSYRAILGGLLRQRRALTRLRGQDLFTGEVSDAHVLVQSTHPTSAALMRQLRHLFPCASIRYYLHEPTSFWEKFRKGDGLLYSGAVYATQWRDVGWADLVYVANSRAKAFVNGVYPGRNIGSKTRVLPLSFPDLGRGLPPGPPMEERRQVLYLGRANKARCLDIFLECARLSREKNLPWTFALLTGSQPDLPAWTRELDNLRVMTGQPFRDEQMAAEMNRSRFVFNLYRVQYTQSGVTPVALMFGVPFVAGSQERSPAFQSAGCVFFDESPTASAILDAMGNAAKPDQAALRRAFRLGHDAAELVIPD